MHYLADIKQKMKDCKNRKLEGFVYFLKDKLHITANFLTAISFITGLISVYFLFENHLLFVIFIILSLIFDILDGALARIESKKAKDWLLDLASDRSIMLLFLIKSYMLMAEPIVLSALILYCGFTGLIIILPILYKKEIKYALLNGGFYGLYILGLYQWGIYVLVVAMVISLVLFIPQLKKS